MVDKLEIKKLLEQKKQMKLFLDFCAACGLCAKSCFLYRNHKHPSYTPSYKAINSLGKLYKKKGMVDRDDLERMKELIWGKCVLCGRCYCPFGINIAGMISWARTICRTQKVFERYDLDARGAALEKPDRGI